MGRRRADSGTRWVMGTKYMWWFFQVAELYAVSSTTPTISKSPEDCVPGEPKRRPIGFSPGFKSLLTKASLTTATAGEVEVSRVVKPRPIRTRVPTESKYSALPLTQDAPSFRTGWPWIWTPSPELLASIGVLLEMPTPLDAGDSMEPAFDGSGFRTSWRQP